MKDMHSNGFSDATMDLEIEGNEGNSNNGALVAIGGKLPNRFQVSTSKLLDVILAFSPRCQDMEGSQRKKFRKTLQQKLYNKTRPGFYYEFGKVLHFGYSGQPGGLRLSISGTSSVLKHSNLKSKPSLQEQP